MKTNLVKSILGGFAMEKIDMHEMKPYSPERVLLGKVPGVRFLGPGMPKSGTSLTALERGLSHRLGPEITDREPWYALAANNISKHEYNVGFADNAFSNSLSYTRDCTEFCGATRSTANYFA
jgi:hypothetical protein